MKDFKSGLKSIENKISKVINKGIVENSIEMMITSSENDKESVIEELAKDVRLNIYCCDEANEFLKMIKSETSQSNEVYGNYFVVEIVELGYVIFEHNNERIITTTFADKEVLIKENGSIGSQLKLSFDKWLIKVLMTVFEYLEKELELIEIILIYEEMYTKLQSERLNKEFLENMRELGIEKIDLHKRRQLDVYHLDGRIMNNIFKVDMLPIIRGEENTEN